VSGAARIVARAWVVVLLLLAPAALAQIFSGDGLRSERAYSTAADAGEEILPEPTVPDAGAPPAPVPPRPSPGFTQDRQFTNARLWLLDTGQITVEQWWSGSWGTPTLLAGPSNPQEQLFQTGIQAGLMPHLELDIYANFDLNLDGSGNYQFSPTGLSGVAAEVRVAIGRYWGQIWGNPVIDAELWGRITEPTRLEGRLLGGGEIFTPRLLGTANLMFARNSFHDDLTGIDYEVKALLGLNYELIPDVLRLGAEGSVGWDSHNTVNAANYTVLFFTAQVGPAILLTEPHKRFKLLFAVLYGLSYWDVPWESQLVLGTTF
jgi:hypothetical protein